MFDIKNQNTFLGGQNIHNLIIIGLLIFIIFKLLKKNEESGFSKFDESGGIYKRKKTNITSKEVFSCQPGGCTCNCPLLPNGKCDISCLVSPDGSVRPPERKN
jgi:hypothetical protein